MSEGYFYQISILSIGGTSSETAGEVTTLPGATRAVILRDLHQQMIDNGADPNGVIVNIDLQPNRIEAGQPYLYHFALMEPGRPLRTLDGTHTPGPGSTRLSVYEHLRGQAGRSALAIGFYLEPNRPR